MLFLRAGCQTILYASSVLTSRISTLQTCVFLASPGAQRAEPPKTEQAVQIDVFFHSSFIETDSLIDVRCHRRNNTSPSSRIRVPRARSDIAITPSVSSYIWRSNLGPHSFSLWLLECFFFRLLQQGGRHNPIWIIPGSCPVILVRTAVSVEWRRVVRVTPALASTPHPAPMVMSSS